MRPYYQAVVDSPRIPFVYATFLSGRSRHGYTYYWERFSAGSKQTVG